MVYQYIKERFNELGKENRESIGRDYYEKGIKRDAWQKDFVENIKFLNRWTSIKYNNPSLSGKRIIAYQKDIMRVQVFLLNIM